MTGVRLRAFAKVNYALEVRGLRPDGYHELSTVFQSISLFDELEIERTEKGFELVVEPEGVEVGPVEENTVYKAWAWFRRTSGKDLPVRMRLRKNVPAGAGLGGGSADAAATLVGLSELFDLPWGPEERRMVAGIGADVPFCTRGGTALGEGVGEVLSPLPTPPAHYLVVAKPEAGANTTRVYRACDEEQPSKGVSFVAPTSEALRAGDLGALARAAGNELSPVTEGFVPEVGALREDLLRAGALGAAMSGTGTAVFGFFASEAEALMAAPELGVPFVAVCEPVERGVVVL